MSGPATINGNTITLTGTGTVVVQADQKGNTSFSAAPQVQRTFQGSAGSAKIQSILNGASYANTALAGDAYASFFGMNFTTQTETGQPPYGNQLGGVTVSMTDSAGSTRPVGLSYVSPTQINFVAPSGLAPGAAAVTLKNSADQSSSFQVNVAFVTPALFTGDATGKGSAAAFYIVVSPDGSQQSSLVSRCSGTPLGCVPDPVDVSKADTSVYVSLYGTGIRGRKNLEAVTVTAGGIPLEVTYAGAQSIYPGLDLVNVLLNRALAGRGQVELQLTVDGVAANPVTINVE